MTRLIFFILIHTLIVLASANTEEIHLYTHSWCPPCRKVSKLFDKFETKYTEISFIRHKYKNKTILYQDDTSRGIKTQLSFPSIVFRCNSFHFRYQNDLSFTELSYWIQAICLKKVPTCSQKINHELYHILAQPYQDKQFKILAQVIVENPHLKICIDNKSNITLGQIQQISEDLSKHPLYFDYFSHNIRNYLIQSKRLAVALITHKKNTTFVQSFLDIYFSLQYHYMNESQQKETPRLYKYQLKKQQAERLLFLQLCMNSNISECLVDIDRKNQVIASQKITDKLLKYLDISTYKLQQFQYIVAFNFDYPRFETYVYHNFGVLDERFLFWINQILTKKSYMQTEKFCIKNMITHRTSQHSLQDIQAHEKLKIIVTSLKLTYNNGFNLYRQQRKHDSQARMTICIQNQKEMHLQSNEEIDQISEMINKRLMVSLDL